MYNRNMQPTIRIKDAWLLRQAASVPLHEMWGKNRKLANDKDMEKIVKNYTEAWKPLENEILSTMSHITKLEFRQNIIDVYIAPWFRAFSDPLVIGVIYEPDLFIDMLTHELLHRLLTDNALLPLETDLITEWKKMFGNTLNLAALVHIPVHAVHKAICVDVLKEPWRIERDIARCKKHNAKDYVTAWNYVEKHGYKTIIKQLHTSYADLAKQST